MEFTLIKNSIKNIKALKNDSSEYIIFNDEGAFIHTRRYNRGTSNINTSLTKISNTASEQTKTYRIPLLQFQKVINLLEQEKREYTVELTMSYEIRIVSNNWKSIFYIKEQDNFDFSYIKQEKKILLTLDYTQAKELIKSNCLSQDTSQVAFLGFHFDFENNKVVSTDGKRLNICSVNFKKQLTNNIYESSMIIQKIKTMKKQDIFTIHYDSDNNLYIDNNNISMIEAKFPNYKDVIPNYEKQIMIPDHKSVLKALKAVAVTSDKESNRMNIIIDKDKLILQTGIQNSSTGIAIKIENPNEYQGSFSVNYKHLQNILIKDNIVMKFAGQGTPIYFDCHNFEGVIMPMKETTGYIDCYNNYEVFEIEPVKKAVKKDKNQKKETFMKKAKNTPQRPFEKLEDFNTPVLGISDERSGSILDILHDPTSEKLRKITRIVTHIVEEDITEFIALSKKVGASIYSITNHKTEEDLTTDYLNTEEEKPVQTIKEILQEIRSKTGANLLLMQQLINTVDQYKQEDRLNELVNDLEKTDFYFLTREEIEVLKDFRSENKAILLALYEEEREEEKREEEKTIQITKNDNAIDNAIIEIIKEEERKEETKIVIKKELDKLLDIQQKTRQIYYSFIVRFFTNRQRTLIYAPTIHTVNTCTETQAIVLGQDGMEYKYSIDNFGKIREKKGRSCGVTFGLSHNPTMEDLKNLESQFKSTLGLNKTA